MSFLDCSLSEVGSADGVRMPASRRPLHRVGTVRRLQGISRRTVARRLDVDVASIKLQERETSDMSLSRLYEWQEVLDVPISELLIDTDDPLSAPVLKRAQLVRVMKTALAIHEATKQAPIRRMAETLIDQLREIMPELEGVGPWHAVGQRRRRDELGRAAERRLSENVFLDLVE